MSLSLSVKAQNVKPSSTLAITEKAKAFKASGLDVVGFGAGEPDFNTPDNIAKAGIDAIRSGFTKYTGAAGIPELKKAVSDKFKKENNLNYEPENVVISNGGKHSLTNVFQAILNPGDEVIIPSPYWLSYPEIVKLADGVPVFVRADKTSNYKVSAEQIKNACTEKTKAVIINSPSNPTGMLYTKEELEAIAKVVVEQDIYVVSDEIYENLIYTGDERVSIGALNDEIFKRTITCNGLAKSYSMTGWRIGFTGAPLPVAKLMASIQSHQTSNPNSIAQKAAVEALTGPQDAVAAMRKEFHKRMEYMYSRICEMPLISTVKPQGAFYVFIDVHEVIGKKHLDKPILDVNDIAMILLDEYKTAVVPCADFGFDDHIRLSYAISMEQIKKGLDRIEDFLNKLV